MCKCKRVLIVAVCLCVRRVKLTDFQWLEIEMTTGQPLAVNPAGGVVPGSQTVNCHCLLTRILETKAHCACMAGGPWIDTGTSHHHSALRSEERSVGEECVRTSRFRWTPFH